MIETIIIVYVFSYLILVAFGIAFFDEVLVSELPIRMYLFLPITAMVVIYVSFVIDNEDIINDINQMH